MARCKENSNTFVKVPLELDVSGDLTIKLVEKMKVACDRAELLGSDAIFTINLIGCTDEEYRKSVTSTADVHLINKWEKCLRRIENLDSIVIAATDYNIGGLGLAIMLIADYRFIATDRYATLSDEVGNVMPGMLLFRLVQQVGIARVRKLVLFGKQISSTELKSIGLIDEVTPRLTESVELFLKEISPLKNHGVATRRRLLLEATSTCFEDALGTHLAACDLSNRAIDNFKSKS